MDKLGAYSNWTVDYTKNMNVGNVYNNTEEKQKRTETDNSAFKKLRFKEEITRYYNHKGINKEQFDYIMALIDKIL